MSEKKNFPSSSKVVKLSVSEAIRKKHGQVKVTGRLIGQSPVYNRISAIRRKCTQCGYENNLNYSNKPRFKSNIPEFDYCFKCDEDKYRSLKAEYEYVTTVDIELQDPDKFNEIERLNAHLFEKDTENIVLGETVTISGSVYIVRKNDNPNNKAITVLYANCFEYNEREELTLTVNDIKEIEI